MHVSRGPSDRIIIIRAATRTFSARQATGQVEAFREVVPGEAGEDRLLAEL